MNYGYAEQGFSLSLLEQDKDERYPLQLYHHTATQVNITNKKALEVGSGRGGGASSTAARPTTNAQAAARGRL